MGRAPLSTLAKSIILFFIIYGYIINSQSGQLPVGRVLHRYRGGHSPWQKRESIGTSFLYCINWKSKHFNWNVTEWKASQSTLRVFGGKIVQMGALQKLQNSIQTLQILWPVYPIHTNSLLQVIFEKLSFCHFPLLNTSILAQDSQI